MARMRPPTLPGPIDVHCELPVPAASRALASPTPSLWRLPPISDLRAASAASTCVEVGRFPRSSASHCRMNSLAGARKVLRSGLRYLLRSATNIRFTSGSGIAQICSLVLPVAARSLPITTASISRRFESSASARPLSAAQRSACAIVSTFVVDTAGDDSCAQPTIANTKGQETVIVSKVEIFIPACNRLEVKF